MVMVIERLALRRGLLGVKVVGSGLEKGSGRTGVRGRSRRGCLERLVGCLLTRAVVVRAAVMRSAFAIGIGSWGSMVAKSRRQMRTEVACLLCSWCCRLELWLYLVAIARRCNEEAQKRRWMRRQRSELLNVEIRIPKLYRMIRAVQ
jgi:hypothetical protein